LTGETFKTFLYNNGCEDPLSASRLPSLDMVPR
jgi:hypothetical protein